MNIPLLDLKAQYATLRHEIEPAVLSVFESQYFIMGPEVAACEKELAEYCHCTHAVGVSSGSDALLIALMAEDIGPGDEVITTPYTFFATVGSIARTGATPVFVDIDPVSFNINPALIEAAITEKTKAIIPVHLYGQMADMDSVMDIARRHKLVVIEDAAQAIGSEYHGHRAGSMGDYGCFSFFPSKNLGGAGDGGLVTIKDAEKAEKVRMLRNHGMEPKYYHQIIGGNFRLDALQAAVVRRKLPYLDQWSAGRLFNALRYDRLFNIPELAGFLTTPSHPAAMVLDDTTHQGHRHIFNQYIIRVKNRDKLKQHLVDQHVGCDIYYPVPLHMQQCFACLGYKEGDFPQSERAAKETLALPIYPELNDEQAAYVAECIIAFYRK
ncbi:MAG: DegT/DnrJ/EryC1/StrS family aminotransferase [Spartobacteria bacterium]|nr:DegT/DnrJ/EryC1/StrS family aminotransferase [Spartobacteria bacterium]